MVAEYGTVDILVNNAGGGSCIPLEELPDEEWRKVLSLDLDGTFYCMKYFGKIMLEKGYGRVINIASILGKGGLKELPVIAYASAKGGVINMTRQAATEWATKGVTVNALCPGFFASEANGPEAMEAMDEFIGIRTPMCRPGKEGELDSSIVFLAAKESTYVTGTILTEGRTRNELRLYEIITADQDQQYAAEKQDHAFGNGDLYAHAGRNRQRGRDPLL